MADITNASYRVSIEAACPYSTPCEEHPFDLFLFDNEDDYNCYVEAVAVFELRGEAKTCSFFETRPDIIHEQVKSHELQSDRFISKEHPYADVFVLVDNTGWLQHMQGRPRPPAGVVTFSLEITTGFEANDLYNKAFIFFASVGGALVLILLI